jgi:hypothetical protein
MATVEGIPSGGYPDTTNLSTAQTGSVATTNTVDRGGSVGPATVRIVTTVGATPTCTYAIQGSIDDTNWFPLLYADSATPATVVATTFAITTATTTHKLISVNQPARYIRLLRSANTNVTDTIDITTY